MKILHYDIPLELINDKIIKSYAQQVEKKGSLSTKQEWYLRDLLCIMETYLAQDFEQCTIEYYTQLGRDDLLDDFKLIVEKIKKNKFMKVSSRNRHVRCAYMFIERKTDQHYILKTLGRDYEF